MLHWDMATVMPDGGRPARAEQLATLGVVCHEILTDAETGDLLDQAEEEASGLDALAARQPRRDAAQLHPCDGARFRAGRGDEQGLHRLRGGVARGAAQGGLRRGLPAAVGGAEPDARGGDGQGREARLHAPTKR